MKRRKQGGKPKNAPVKNTTIRIAGAFPFSPAVTFTFYTPPAIGCVCGLITWARQANFYHAVGFGFS